VAGELGKFQKTPKTEYHILKQKKIAIFSQFFIKKFEFVALKKNIKEEGSYRALSIAYLFGVLLSESAYR